MDFNKKADQVYRFFLADGLIPHRIRWEYQIEKALKEVWNEAIEESARWLVKDNDTEHWGEFFARRIRELKEK